MISLLIPFIHKDLQELTRYHTSNHGGGSSYSWDNFTRYHFNLIHSAQGPRDLSGYYLIPISLVDLIVSSTQVGRGCNEVDMEVGIIILFELSWADTLL